MFGFLTWAAAGAAIPVTGLLFGVAAPRGPADLRRARRACIGERVGVVNIAIEGQLLAGAFTAAVVASITGSPSLGLIAAMVAGVLVGVRARGVRDQVPRRPGHRRRRAQRARHRPHELPLLAGARAQRGAAEHAAALRRGCRSRCSARSRSSGRCCSARRIIVYLMYVAVALVCFGLFQTRWGLRLRAVGEHPQAADTVGIKVNRTRFWNVVARRRDRRPRRRVLHARLGRSPSTRR